MIDITAPCPCSSGDSYKDCCRRFHSGVPVENALQLMRSRFSAYSLGLADYIISTTHPANPEFSENKFSWRRGITQFIKNTSFDRLEILDFKEKRSMATVTFIAHITQNGRDATFTEKSYFESLRGQWLYRGGQLTEGRSPNMVTVGQLKVLPLAYYGEPVLRKKAETVQEITPELKMLIDEMVETMDVSDGIGLAAPQVHHSIRLFITRCPIKTEEGSFESGDVEVFINPEIVEVSKETWVHSEGCLSIPGIRSEVERPLTIKVEYTNREGERVSKEFSEMGARVILHENDHINGVLFIDRLEKDVKESIKPYLSTLQKRIHGEKSM